eukprot:6208637-Pleurochrysis_carterae.AAC.1
MHKGESIRGNAHAHASHTHKITSSGGKQAREGRRADASRQGTSTRTDIRKRCSRRSSAREQALIRARALAARAVA